MRWLAGPCGLAVATWQALRTPMLAAEQHARYRLVVCNAVPDDAAIAVRLNGNTRLLSGLSYETCVEASGTIAEHDELEFLSPTVGAWTFQVGPLPAGAGRLLLVFEQDTRHPGFRAVALPPAAEDTAAVAVLDTRHGRAREKDTRHPPLRVKAAGMQQKPGSPQAIATDPHGAPGQSPVAVATADLEFDHVYTLDAGEFEVSLAKAEQAVERAEAQAVEKAEEAIAAELAMTAKLHAAPKESYVVMRTGRPDQGYPESLIVFAAGKSFAAVATLLLPLLLRT